MAKSVHFTMPDSIMMDNVGLAGADSILLLTIAAQSAQHWITFHFSQFAKVSFYVRYAVPQLTLNSV